MKEIQNVDTRKVLPIVAESKAWGHYRKKKLVTKRLVYPEVEHAATFVVQAIYRNTLR